MKSNSSLKLISAARRFKAERRSGACQRKYRRLFEGSKDLIFITYKDGKLIEVNQACVDLLGYRRYEAAARENLPKIAYDYYRSGANDEITLHENHDAYERIKLKPRVLRDISKRDLTTTVLGQTVSMPILVAPTAFHCMAHPEGEVATARAAGTAGHHYDAQHPIHQLDRRRHVGGHRPGLVSTLCLQRS